MPGLRPFRGRFLRGWLPAPWRSRPTATRCLRSPPKRSGCSRSIGARDLFGLLGICAACVLCATGVATAIGVAMDRRLQRPDWRVVATMLGPHSATGADRIILVQHYRDLLPLSLYLPHLSFWRNHRPVLTR